MYTDDDMSLDDAILQILQVPYPCENELNDMVIYYSVTKDLKSSYCIHNSLQLKDMSLFSITEAEDEAG